MTETADLFSLSPLLDYIFRTALLFLPCASIQARMVLRQIGISFTWEVVLLVVLAL